MTTVELVEGFTTWLNENVCGLIKLKRPPLDDTGRGEFDVVYEQVSPVAYPFFSATKETLPKGVKTPVPSIEVALKEGKETGSAGTLNIDLIITTWCDGIYYTQKAIPECASANDEADLASGIYRARTQETWRDVQNTIDVLIRELSLNPFVCDGALKIDKDAGFTFNLFSDSSFPYIHGKLSIVARYIAARTAPAINQFL